LAALTLALLAGGAAAQPVIPARASPPGAAQTNALHLHRLDAAMAPGANLGGVSHGDACDNRTPLVLEPATGAELGRALRRAIGEGFAAAGYRDPLLDTTSPDLHISAAIEHFRTRHCLRPTGTRTLGQLETRVRWEISDPSTNAVLFAKTTAGQYRSMAEVPLTEADYYRNGFLPTVNKLLAEREFRDLAFNTLPERPDAKALPRLTLGAAPPPAGSVADALARVGNSVVTVRTAGRSGSGFFISADGHLLTTSHVVGDGNEVKLTLADGREVDARVLRRHRGREVALLKTEMADAVPLPVRDTPALLESDVLAFGAPTGVASGATLHHGLVRELPVVNARRFIRTDARVSALSEGGPLVGSDATVVGLALEGDGRNNTAIPVDDALLVLGVSFVAP
jgi:hypothetical protein